MRNKSEFPKSVKVGSVVVKVYRIKHKTTKSGWAYSVAHIAQGGARKLTQFADLAQAMEEARLKAGQLAAGRIEGAEMSRSERDDLQAAREICGEVPLIAALQEWKRVRDLTNGNAIAAAETWAARSGVSYKRIKLSDAVNLFMKKKEADGVDMSCSYKKILPSLQEALGQRMLDSITSRDLGEWMVERYSHAVTRNTARKRVVTLWRWARKNGYLPRDAQTEAEQTDAARETDAEIGTITGQTFGELLRFFKTKHPEYLGPLILAGFCGLRRSEIHDQVWEDVNLDEKFIRVSKAKRNTPAKRLVPLCDAAVKWLRLCNEREGQLCANLAIDRIRSIARDAGFVLPENAFRHSYISHRVAQTGNVAEVSLEAGNSPRIIHKHYRGLFTKADGRAWFSIAP